MLARREVELDRHGPRVEREAERRAERGVGEREDAHADRGQVERVGSAEPARRHREPGRIGEAVAGNEAPQLVDELERTAEAYRLVARAQLHGDVGLGAVLRDERDLLEPEDDEPEQVHLEVGQRRGGFRARRHCGIERRAHDAVHGQAGRWLARVGARDKELRIVGFGDVARPLEARFDAIGKVARHHPGDVRAAELAAARQDLAELDAAEQGGVLEEIRGIESAAPGLVELAFDRLRIGGVLAGHRPDDLGQAEQAHLRRGERAERVALGFARLSAERQVLRLRQLEEDLARVLRRVEAVRIVEIGVGDLGDVVGHSKKLLDRLDADLRDFDFRIDPGHGRALRQPRGTEGDRLGRKLRVTLVDGIGRRIGDDRAADRGPPPRRGQRGAVRLAHVHPLRLGELADEQQRHGEPGRESRDVRRGDLERHVGKLVHPYRHHRPEQHARHEAVIQVLDVLGGVHRVLVRLQPAFACARIAQVRGHACQQLDAREWEVAAGERVVRAAVRAHGLAHGDEEPLAQERDAPRVLRIERFELSLRHLDERGGVPERPQVARVHHAHILVAAQRGHVPPLRKVDVLGRLRPGPFGIEQRAERGQVEPLGFARDGVVGGAARHRFVEPGHGGDEHRAIHRIEAHPDEIRVRRGRDGQRRRRVQEGDDLVLARLRPIVGRPQRADARCRVGTGPRRVVAEPRVPELGVRAMRDRRDRVAPACGRQRRRDDAIGQLQRGHGRRGLAGTLLLVQFGDSSDQSRLRDGRHATAATCRRRRHAKLGERRRELG